MTKPNLHNIFLQTQLYKGYQMENTNKRRETTPQKKQGNLSRYPKEQSHTNIVTPLKTKITGSKNHFSLISVSINGFNFPIKKKKQQLTDWIHKQFSTICCIQESHLSDKDRHYLRAKGWKTLFQGNWSQETRWSSHSNIEEYRLSTKVSKILERTLYTGKRKNLPK